jgi:hypothetical protein
MTKERQPGLNTVIVRPAPQHWQFWQKKTSCCTKIMYTAEEWSFL